MIRQAGYRVSGDRHTVSEGALNYLEYEEVGKQQVYLTIEMEIELVDEYKRVRDELHKYVISKNPCRDLFIERYKDLMSTGKSVAKLSREFNPREKGEAEKVERWIIQNMNNYFVNHRTDKSWDWEEMFFDLRISDACINEMIGVMQPTKKLAKLQGRLREIEDLLLRSMLMAAHEIALRNTANIKSIDYRDAKQETLLFLLESIRRYDPDFRTPQGQRIKLVTYAYGRAERLLKEWILTTSRLVRVPRSKMERILIIVRAYHSMLEHEINVEDLTKEANTHLKEGAKPFTIDEADDLIRILTSNYIHLDQPFNKNYGRSSGTTIGDMLTDTEVTAEDEASDSRGRERLLKIIEEVLTKTEKQIINLRYFNNPLNKIPCPHVEVARLLVSEYQGKEYSRESIRQIEAKALNKLRNVRGVQELWNQ
jgi:RNA polymerase sigma factor (sigma-70 family)